MVVSHPPTENGKPHGGAPHVDDWQRHAGCQQSELPHRRSAWPGADAGLPISWRNLPIGIATAFPERTVHADGRGAYDTLTVAHDITKYIRVKARGAAVGQRDRRGFARRFQTKEGNGEFGGNDSWKS